MRLLAGQRVGAGGGILRLRHPGPGRTRTRRDSPGLGVLRPGLGEFLLRYEEVGTAAVPDGVLLAYLQSTYEAADLAG